MVASGVALAAEIRCPNSIGNRCIGTNEADTMTGTNQDDDMVGLGGADKMVARGGADTLFGGGGSDDISAGPGNDPSVNGGTGDDLLSGESGDDTYVFRVRGNWGADRIPIGGEGAGMGTDELGFALLTDSLDIELVSSPDRDEVASDAGMLNSPRRSRLRTCLAGRPATLSAETTPPTACPARVATTNSSAAAAMMPSPGGKVPTPWTGERASTS
jgi:Ca2+-binding RTX toxin-like protein